MTALLLEREPRAEEIAEALRGLNEARLRPATRAALSLEEEIRLRRIEREFLESECAAIASRASEAPESAQAFMQWFEGLRENGPGQNDRFFPWLASHATRDKVRGRGFRREDLAKRGRRVPEGVEGRSG